MKTNSIMKVNKIYISSITLHDGVFHADDLLCAALLDMVAYESIYGYTLCRTRKISKEKIKADALILYHYYKQHYGDIGGGFPNYSFILDVGDSDSQEIDPDTKNRLISFDHHSSYTAAYYDNGIKYAACGKLFDWLINEKILEFDTEEHKQEFVEEFRRTVLWPVELQDNGQKRSDFEEEVEIYPHLFTFVSYMNNTYLEEQDPEAFTEASELVAKILTRTIDHIIAKIAAKDEFEDAVKNAIKVNDTAVVLPLNRYLPCAKYIKEANQKDAVQIVGMIYPDLDPETWSFQVVNEASTVGIHALFPESWAGKRDKELAKESGINSSVFCHIGRWLFKARSKNDISKAIEMLVIENNKE